MKNINTKPKIAGKPKYKKRIMNRNKQRYTQKI